MSPYEEENYLQIAIDVKRTTPAPVFSLNRIKNILTRVLFIWTFKHPASGYVQGINDLAATLLYVFLLEEIDEKKGLTEEAFNELDEDVKLRIESDTYWCLEKFSENIQANYTEGQPGVYEILKQVEKLTKKKDPELI